jgi:hypothetical protein
MKLMTPLLFCLFANVASGQQAASVIRPGTDTLTVYVVSARDTTAIGTVIDEIVFVESAGRRVLRRAYHSEDQMMGARIDTLVDDAVTLAPISHRSRSSRSLEFVEFRDGRAAGWLRLANGDSVGIDAALDRDVYNASSFDLVLRSAPLHETWKAEIRSFLPATRSIIPLNAEVAGSDTIDGEATWRIQTNFAGTPVTFWVGKESRRLKRQFMRLRPDMGILIAPPKHTRLPRNAT